ncbi:CHAT domain-containing protein [Solwaraspora sp. WMMB335]|uniref:CHAT domain-containing protein n=1 Tax=Solwaraspora sp. WMMB335 TaxID=3404118 RepID=UPI003B95C59A
MLEGVSGVVKAIRRRARANDLAEQGRYAEAREIYRELAEFRSTHDRVIGAMHWLDAANQSAKLEDRAAQLAECRRALETLPPQARWRTRLTVQTGFESLLMLADALQWLERVGEAESVARRAVAFAETASDRFRQMEAYVALQQVYYRDGRSAQALGCARRVLELAEPGDSAPLLATVMIEQGHALADLQQFDHALRSIDDGLAEAAQIPDESTVAMLRISALSGKVAVKRNSGDFAGAIADAKELMLFCQRQRPAQYMAAKLTWATAEVEGGDLERGSAELVESYRELIERGELTLAGRAANNLASAMFRRGRLAEAREWSRDAVRLSVRGGINNRGAVHYNLAYMMLAAGDAVGAEAEIRQALDDWEELRRTVSSDRINVDVLQRQGTIYRLWQVCRLLAGDTAGCLEVFERTRGRSLLRTIRPGSVEDPHVTVADAVRLAERWETGFLVCSLLSPMPQAQQLSESEYAGLHMWLVDARGVTYRSIGPEMVYTTEVNPATAPDPFLGLTREIEMPMAHPDLGLNLEALSKIFIEPLEGTLTGSPARNLVLIPHGELERVPFSALRLSSGERVVDRWPVAVVPSMAVFAELAARATPRGRTHDLLLVGNPTSPRHPFSPGFPVPDLPTLVHAEREVNEIASVHGDARPPLVGAAATKAAVLARIEGCGMVHFATHGVQGASSGETPGALCLSPDGDDDGYLRSDEVARLRLTSCRLAVLSACRTGWGQSTYEGTLGLARAFLAAGARAVVVSLWPVHDEATADLMIELHRQLRSGLPVGEALRRGMLHLRRTGTDARDWAAFTVVGDPDATGLRLGQ